MTDGRDDANETADADGSDVDDANDTAEEIGDDASLDRQQASDPTTKIGRVGAKYDLDGVGDDLERLWLGEGGEKASTRELADEFNRRVLRAAVEESDAYTLSGDVNQVYRTLVGDSDRDETLVRSRLEQSGVDVDAVTGDFVSHQTVYRYLRDHRGVERETPSARERALFLVSRDNYVTGEVLIADGGWTADAWRYRADRGE